jgi:glycosyltransferase involved in cell wall biosynthesis
MSKVLVDVTICTLNSEHSIEDCINSILRELPVNKIICVDGGSTDSTIDILKKYKEVELFIRPDLNLGQSRSFAFSKVTTDWFVQIDSDVILEPGAGKTIMSYIGKGDVVEFGILDYWVFPMPSEKDIISKKYEKRAFFFTNLIKTDSIKGYVLNVKNYEEELLRAIIKKNNKSWIKTGIHVGNHFSKPVRYKDRNIIGIMRIRPFPDFVFEDKGYVDKIKGISLLRSFFEAIKFYAGPIINQLIKCIRSINNPARAIYFYYKGYFSGKKYNKYE